MRETYEGICPLMSEDPNQDKPTASRYPSEKTDTGGRQPFDVVESTSALSSNVVPLAAPAFVDGAVQHRPIGRNIGSRGTEQLKAVDGGTAAAADTDSDGSSEGADRMAKRRRGSRGGRKRRKPDSPRVFEGSTEVGGSTVIQESEYERRPADLPDSPFEGVPTPQAAQRPAERPKIGDRRPAPVVDLSSNSALGKRAETDSAASQRISSRPPKSVRPDSGTSPSKTAGTAGAPAVEREATNPSGERAGRRRSERSDKSARSRSGEARQKGAEGDGAEKRRGRERNGRPVGRYLMCVHAREQATQIAVLEGRSLIEHYVSRPTDQVGQIHGNIYVGRVQNVLPGMEAAFVDIGTPKNAVLYRGDLQFDAGDIENGAKQKTKQNDVRIEQLLKNGQIVLCQVTKNPIGSKGARLTQEVSIPGRFVVLIPNSDTYGISKRLPDDERKRLRRILDQVRPPQHGLIVRTAAEGATADELHRDIEMLTKQWDQIEERAKRLKNPALLYKEPDMTVRVIREEFNRNYRGVVIDDRELYEEIRSYVESITPELADRVEYHDPTKEPLPLFERHHVHEQLHKAIDRKVWLPSGGSLIIERTEALTVIDVNTGKNVGSSSLEETVFRNNLEAAEEIARQLRLRDIGGIIVIDFIDMETRANRDAVVNTFRDSLSRDKTRSQVFEISELGLVEMTRKRISEGLVESLSSACPMCDGRGMIFDEAVLSE